MKKEIKHPKEFIGLMVGSTLASPIIMLIFYLANPGFFFVAIALMPLLTLIPNICFICASFFFLVKQKPLRVKIVFLFCNIALLLWNLLYIYIVGFFIFDIFIIVASVYVLLNLTTLVCFIIQNTKKNKNVEDDIYEKK